MTDETPPDALDVAKAAARERMAKARAARGVKTTIMAPSIVAEPSAAPDVAERAAVQRERAEVAAIPVETGAQLSNNTRVANKLSDEAALRARAARQRVDAGPDVEGKMVKVRITKRGDGKVSMGQHVAGVGEAYYEWKEEPSFPEVIAKALEERDFVEIL